jgi:hypothetical protein
MTEHGEHLVVAQEALLELRKRLKKLNWISGGRGYDNMGKRELENCRNKLDELDFWLAAASRSLYAGSQRAASLGYGEEGR